MSFGDPSPVSFASAALTNSLANSNSLAVSTITTEPLRFGLCHTIGTLPVGASPRACSIAGHKVSFSVRFAST
jgi:hypothetical protein